MTATSATSATAHPNPARARSAGTRSGGPSDDRPKMLEHLAGWTLVAVLAMLVTQLGLL
ncbi:SCO1431 family membrane protein [Streptomyces sp. NPDC091292]|uniref:SCO1431 family membrane protein n=1 Tax=Streptomyces sp. NPDC091292 TaxID=3365991 RepID=UPI0038237CAE